jgi:hypothetical protein
MNTTNTDFTTILAGDLWDLAETILRAQGRQRFYADWDKELAGPLVSRAVPTTGVPLIPRHGQPSLRLQVTRQPARRSRRLDYSRLRAERSDLYSQFVTETSPAIPLRLTFRAAQHMTKSEEWDAIRSEAWAGLHAQLGEKRAASLELRSLSDIGATLREVRDRNKGIKTAEAKARGDLAAAILERVGQADVVFQRAGDGRLFTPAAPPTRSADLDAVQAHPLAARYVRTSLVKESTRVWFQSEAFDPEGDGDPFEGD